MNTGWSVLDGTLRDISVALSDIASALERIERGLAQGSIAVRIERDPNAIPPTRLGGGPVSPYWE